MRRTLTIKPPPSQGGPMLTNGTQVLCDNGAPLPGITKITLTAEGNDVWKGIIETHSLVLPPEGIVAECELEASPMLEEALEAIQSDFNYAYVRIELDGSLQIDGTLELADLEELCARVRKLVK